MTKAISKFNITQVLTLNAGRQWYSSMWSMWGYSYW